MVGVRIDVGIDSEAHRSPAAKPAGNVADNLDLFKGFDHESPDTHLEGLADLLVGLGNSRKEYLFGLIATTYSEFYLVSAHAVRTDALGTEDVIEPVVRICLY